MDDHPIDAARKIIASTGTALGNGAYDTLPASWGYGLSDLLIDHEDMGRWKGYSSPSAGSADWDWVSLTAQANGLQWLQSRLSLGGFFLAIRQGRVTCRCCQDLNDGTVSALDPGLYQTGIEITDDDVLTWDAWESWDTSYGTESLTTKIVTDSSSSTTTGHINGLPAENIRTYDLSSLIFANEPAHRANLAGRMPWWSNRIPERVVCTTGGLSHARLCAGDVVSITTTAIGPRTDRSGAGYQERRAMIVRSSPDWWNGSVVLDLAVMGDRDNEYA